MKYKRKDFTKMRHYIKSRFPYLSLVIFLCSCNILTAPDSEKNTEEIQVLLPDWPPAVNFSATEAETSLSELNWPELDSWEISTNIKKEKFSFEAGTKSFFLRVPKNKPVIILASPVTVYLRENSFSESVPEKIKYSFFYPAGGVYPHCVNTTDDTHEASEFCPGKNYVNLTWEGGFTSTIASRLLNSSKSEDLTMKFNWAKMNQVIQSKNEMVYIEQKKQPYNPWNCDKDKIILNITGGKFSATTLNQPSLLEIPKPKDAGLLSPYVPENFTAPSKNAVWIPSATKDAFLKFPFLYENREIILFYPLNGTQNKKGSKKYSLEVNNLPIIQ